MILGYGEFTMGYFYSDEELAHHGILGQKWGVRRYQNADGSLTSAGKKRAIKDSKTYWGKQKNQPSSVKSSVLAGLTAATNSRTLEKMLDKSNDQDAIRWISAHYIGGTPINEISNFNTTLGKEKVNQILEKLK